MLSPRIVLLSRTRLDWLKVGWLLSLRSDTTFMADGRDGILPDYSRALLLFGLVYSTSSLSFQPKD